MIKIPRPNGEIAEVHTLCDFNTKCRECPQYMNDCSGDVDHDPTLLEDCDIKDTPWGEQSE